MTIQYGATIDAATRIVVDPYFTGKRWVATVDKDGKHVDVLTVGPDSAERARALLAQITGGQKR